jgi:D-tyrosyl-tRNA(Tyr) deacylase
MRAVVQRVSSASVEWEGGASSVGAGALVLLGVSKADSEASAAWLAGKCLNLRFFSDENGNLNRSILETGGDLLVVSQFTLYGDCRKGRRPSFDGAAPPAVAIPLYERFVSELRASGLRVATGSFGAMMRVTLVNEGPVTLIVEGP